MAELLTPAEAGAVLGLTSDGVKAAESRGELRSERTQTGRRLYRRKDVETLAEKRSVARKGHP